MFFSGFFLDNLKELCIILQLSPFVIGLLVLGIDPEELIVSIMAAVNGLPLIAIGNVMGNSIIALTLCFTLPALFQNIDLKSISNFYFIILYGYLGALLLSFFVNQNGWCTIIIVFLRISYCQLFLCIIKELMINAQSFYGISHFPY
ncbi:MAG: hypothetical protein ACTSV5_12900 [Promethearchaeota archaeon]